MNSLISFDQLEVLLTASPEPPYFLLLAGFLILSACAIPLMLVVEQRIKYWSDRLSPDILPARGGLEVLIPATGTAAGFCIFLASAFEVLGLPVLPSLFFALVLTILLSVLGWLQLGRVLSRRAVRSYLNQAREFPSTVSRSKQTNRRGSSYS